MTAYLFTKKTTETNQRGYKNNSRNIYHGYQHRLYYIIFEKASRLITKKCNIRINNIEKYRATKERGVTATLDIKTMFNIAGFVVITPSTNITLQN